MRHRENCLFARVKRLQNFGNHAISLVGKFAERSPLAKRHKKNGTKKVCRKFCAETIVQIGMSHVMITLDLRQMCILNPSIPDKLPWVFLILILFLILLLIGPAVKNCDKCRHGLRFAEPAPMESRKKITSNFSRIRRYDISDLFQLLSPHHLRAACLFILEIIIKKHPAFFVFVCKRKSGLLIQ